MADTGKNIESHVTRDGELKSGGRSSKRCGNCSKRGHLAKCCPFIKCFFCGKLGHTQKGCFGKRMNKLVNWERILKENSGRNESIKKMNPAHKELSKDKKQKSGIEYGNWSPQPIHARNIKRNGETSKRVISESLSIISFNFVLVPQKLIIPSEFPSMSIPKIHIVDTKEEKDKKLILEKELIKKRIKSENGEQKVVDQTPTETQTVPSKTTRNNIKLMSYLNDGKDTHRLLSYMITGEVKDYEVMEKIQIEISKYHPKISIKPRPSTPEEHLEFAAGVFFGSLFFFMEPYADLAKLEYKEFKTSRDVIPWENAEFKEIMVKVLYGVDENKEIVKIGLINFCGEEKQKNLLLRTYKKALTCAMNGNMHRGTEYMLWVAPEEEIFKVEEIDSEITNSEDLSNEAEREEEERVMYEEEEEEEYYSEINSLYDEIAEKRGK